MWHPQEMYSRIIQNTIFFGGFGMILVLSFFRYYRWWCVSTVEEWHYAPDPQVLHNFFMDHGWPWTMDLILYVLNIHQRKCEDTKDSWKPWILWIISLREFWDIFAVRNHRFSSWSWASFHGSTWDDSYRRVTQMRFLSRVNNETKTMNLAELFRATLDVWSKVQCLEYIILSDWLAQKSTIDIDVFPAMNLHMFEYWVFLS